MEEVLNLQRAVLRQVGTMDGVADAVNSEPCAKGVWAELLSQLWIEWTA